MVQGTGCVSRGHSGGSPVVYGFLLSFESALLISRTNQRGLVCLMGGDLVMQKNRQAVAPRGQSFSVLAPALGGGPVERLKPWALESGK